MKVITDNPIIRDSDSTYRESDWFSEASGATRRARRRSRKAKRQAKGTFGQRLQSGLSKLQNVGQSVMGALDQGQQSLGNMEFNQQDFPPMPIAPEGPPPPPPRRGLSTAAKVGIGLAVAGAVIGGVWFMTRKKK